jgi:hypothetical protein
MPFDPIDEARRQWRRHWGGAPVPSMAAVTSIMRAQQILLGRLNELLKPWDLTFPRYEALMPLYYSHNGSLPGATVNVVGVNAVLGDASRPLAADPPELRVHVSATCDDTELAQAVEDEYALRVSGPAADPFQAALPARRDRRRPDRSRARLAGDRVEGRSMRVGELACGRAGDKGPILDLTLVARDAAAYVHLERQLDATAVEKALSLGPVRRYTVPGLHALKYVLPEALGGGVYASQRAGLHWQKAAVRALLDLDLPAPVDGRSETG